MTVARIAACTVKGCPAPRDPDWHVPFCGHGLEGHHHHVPKRSQGGKRIVAFLCPDCHDKVDNTPDWENAVAPGEGGQEEYILWDTRVEGGWNHPLICRPLEAGSAAADRVGAGDSERLTETSPVRSGGEALNRPLRQSAAAPPVSGEDRAGEGGESASALNERAMTDSRTQRADKSRSLVPGVESGPSPAPFSLETWCQEGMKLVYLGLSIRDATDGLRFAIGDWMNNGEGRLGEEVYGYLRAFKDVTVRQYSWVAAMVPRDTRVTDLDWSHHRAVAALESGEQKEWLEKAQEGNLTSKELYRAIHGEKPRVKKWTLEELRELGQRFDKTTRTLGDAWYAFLNWLEGK